MYSYYNRVSKIAYKPITFLNIRVFLLLMKYQLGYYIF